MKSTVLAGLLTTVCFARLQAQAAPPTRPVQGALPADAKMERFSITPDTARTYYMTTTGEVWVHDRKAAKSQRVAEAGAWDLDLSPARTALAYVKPGTTSAEQNVWVLPLDPATGLAAGPERKLSARSGDVPAFSPDGKLVAFARDDASGVGQSIVVASVSGGNERVVAAALPSSIANIRWTPDGRTLYFGVNPPVACVPEWSCLPLAPKYRQQWGSIRRVAAAGGAVTTVATAKGFFPGLSPDGKTLVYIDTTVARRWVVADANGQRQRTFTLPASQSVHGWLSGSTMLIASGGQVRRLRSVSLTDGTSRTLLETNDPVNEPRWSPDGKMFSMVSRVAGKMEIRLSNPDGTLRTSLALPATGFVQGTSWSPDQRWISYTVYPDSGAPTINAIEIATGKVTPLVTVSTEAQTLTTWLSDSRGLVMSELLGGTGAGRHVLIRRVGLDKSVTVLRDAVLGPTPSAGSAIDDHRALLLRAPGEYRSLALTGDSVERSVLPAGAGIVSGPVVSADGAWFVVRRNPRAPNNAEMNVLEVSRTDGTARTTIQLPFFSAQGTTMHILPGGSDVVVVENRRMDVDPGVYLVNVATQSAKKLFTFFVQGGPPDISVSPVDRTMLAFALEPVPPSIFTMDLSTSK